MDEVIARAKKLINRPLKKDSWDFTGLTKSKLIDTRNLLDRLLEPASPRNDWTRLFCRQLGRLMNYYKSFPNDFWVQLHDDLLYILDESNGEQNKSNSWTRFLERMKLETELEQRELHFQQTFGERKSLNELFCEHTEFLEEYLQKCISLHSKLQIRGFVKKLDDFLCKNYGLTEAMLTSESRKRLEEKLRCVEITLDCSNRSLTEFDLPFSKYDKSYTTTDESLRNFLPSTEPPLPLEKNHNQESTKSKRWFVILGDPGSAKTSFLRWIMRTFAEAAHRGDDIIVLGRYDYLPVRIPILIRIGEFAAWLDQHQTKALIDYIGEHTWFTERYCRNDNKNVLKELIYHGHALILLDGLDEIPDMGRRGQIVNHVRKFIDEYVRAPNFISAFDSATFDVRRLYTSNEKLFGIPPPCKSSGNQIIVTSRIVGYKLYPIMGPSIQHSSLLLMNHQEAKQFVNDWMLQVEKAVVEVLLNEGFKPDEETMTASSQKRSNVIKMMFENSSHLIMSSPSLLSLICTFFFQSSVEFCPKSRIEVYDHAVQSTLYSWRNQQLNISESVLTNFLIDLATYLHLQSPSGLIDAFDMEQLCCSSLRQQNVSDNPVQLREYARKLISLLDTNVTIVTERGLLVFGFLHLSFQEYFAARRLVRGSSIDEIAKRILTYTINPRFRESILLALSWISWKWSLDDYDKFCNLLVTPTMDFAIPLGALLFFDAFNDLLRLPSNSVIFTALNTLLDHPSHIITKTYLKSNLLKLHEDIITEWMQSYLKDNKRLSKFCKCFLSEISKSNDESDWSNYELLPSVIYQQLQLFHNMNTSTAFIIDQTLRRTVTPGYKPDDIYKNELSSYFKKHNICTSNIHPAILSVIIAVCNGINIEIRRKPSLKELEDMGQIPDENAEDSIKMDFSFKKMYRESSILLQIIEYFANDKEPHSVKIQTLIRNYENILQSSSSADTSLNIVDTFIALICLQGLSDLSMYGKYDGYQALPIALDRLKWVWYYCSSMFSVSDQALEIFLASEVNSIKSVLFAQHNPFDEQSMAFSLLCTIAWNKLDNISSSYQSNFNIDCNNNIEQSSECQPEFVHSVKWINLCKMTQNSYPFEKLQQKSFLLFTFVPQSLQKLYYRLIISPTSNIDSLPLVVFLSQCLILFEDVTQNDWNFYLALSMLQPLFKVYMLEHYISVLFWKNTSTRGYRKDNRKEFLNAMKDQMSFNGSVIDEQQDWEIFINVERQRIVEAINATQNQETDERLFAASVSLARLFQARYRSCKYRTANDISLSSPESKEIHLVIINILDPLLRIIAQSMILDMKNPFIFDEEKRYQLQWEMINLLQSLLPHLSLLKSVLLFIRCYPIYQIFPIHFQHMANAIG